MRGHLVSIGILLAVLALCAGGYAWWNGRGATVDRRRAALRAEADAINDQLVAMLRAVEASDATAEARQAVAAAQVRYDAKVAASESIAAARRAADDAIASQKETVTTELAQSPEMTQANQDEAAADEALFDAESELRIAKFVLAELRRGAARAPTIAPLRDALNNAEEALYAAKQTSGPDAVSLKATRDAAARALDDAVSARLTASPAGAAQIKRVTDLEQRVATARAAHRAAGDRVTATRARVTKTNPAIARAIDAAEEADANYRAAVRSATAVERAELDDARAAVTEAVRAAMEADPKVAELERRLQTLSAEIGNLNDRLAQAARAN